MWLGWLLLALVALPGAAGADLDANASAPRIVELHPNPVAHMDRGEFVVVEVPGPTNTSGWAFVDDDGQRAVPPPARVEGRVAFSRHPALVEGLVAYPVYPLEGWLQLANAGERLALRVDGREVDRVAYDGPAPPGDVWVRTPTGHRWEPLGATDIAPVTGRGDATAFVLPDAPEVARFAIDNATERVHLGGYTLADPAVVDALIGAHERGVDVAVHVEGRPVGGVSAAMGAALDRLHGAGIPVTVHHGAYARWGYHHAKYAVVDDRLVVLTENWKPSGVGGRTNRGWGAIVDAPAVVEAAADLFDADSSWRDARPWGEARDAIDRHEVDPAEGGYPRRIDPADLTGITATLLVTPDNAEGYLVDRIAAATRTVDVVQVGIADPGFPLMRAALDAAEGGARVRVMLSGAWEVRERNEALAAELRRIAETRDLDVRVRVVEPGERFGRIHTKGVIVDGETVVVSSINWNNHSLRANREVALVLEGGDVGAYYLAAFEADWPGPPTWRVPLGLVLAAVVAGAAVARHAADMAVEGPAAADGERHTDRGDP